MSCRALTLALALGWGLAASAAPPGLRVLTVKAPSGEARFASRQAGETGFFAVFPGQLLRSGDELRTGPGTVVALELPDGSRLALNPLTYLKVDDAAATRLTLQEGALWAASSSSGPHQLSLVADGRRFAVRGTEFTLEGGDGKLDNLAVFEGAVDVSGVDGRVDGTAGAGDAWQEEPGSGWARRHVDPAELRAEVSHGDLALAFTWLADELGSLRGDFESAARKLEKLQAMLNGGGRGNASLGAPFGAAWSTLAHAQSLPDTEMQAQPDLPGRPHFRWREESGAAAYALFVAHDPACDDVVFSLVTRSSDAVYPSTGRPLPAGIYHWFVVPLDESDRPHASARRSQFVVGR